MVSVEQPSVSTLCSREMYIQETSKQLLVPKSRVKRTGLSEASPGLSRRVCAICPTLAQASMGQSLSCQHSPLE